MDGDATIDGDTRGGDGITTTGGATITGNATANGTISTDGSSEVEGETTEDADPIVNRPPINELVEGRTENLRDENDNNRTPVIQDEELQISGGSATLEPGAYYLENLDLQGEELVLNATDATSPSPCGTGCESRRTAA